MRVETRILAVRCVELISVARAVGVEEWRGAAASGQIEFGVAREYALSILERRDVFMSAQGTQKPGAYTDPLAVDPGHYKVELENDRVRVLRIKFRPGEKSVMHGHPATVTIFLGDASFRFTYPDGKTEDGTVTAGEVMYFDALQHLPENTGDKPFEVIAVELKS
jgi:quercetin dioxygenase-like cupin family protein